jgi:hypothetical protein
MDVWCYFLFAVLAVEAVDAEDADEVVRLIDGIRESPCLGAVLDVDAEADGKFLVVPDVFDGTDDPAPGDFEVNDVGFLGDGRAIGI